MQTAHARAAVVGRERVIVRLDANAHHHLEKQVNAMLCSDENSCFLHETRAFGSVTPTFKTLVAKRGSTPFAIVAQGKVHAVVVVDPPNMFVEQPYFYIRSLCVAHDSRRSGCGTQLLEFLKRMYPRLQLVVWTDKVNRPTRLIKFYERHGFKRIDTPSDPHFKLMQWEN